MNTTPMVNPLSISAFHVSVNFSSRPSVEPPFRNVNDIRAFGLSRYAATSVT